jgi:mRNA degradation ribonuclease J1/J2
MLQLAFLGTGSSSSTEKNPSSFALSNGDEMILIDTGGSSYHQISGLNNKNFSSDITENIFLTHFHMDHVSGLPDFICEEIWNSRGQRTIPLNITGPKGLHDFWYKRFIPFFNREIPFQVNLHELSDGGIYNKFFCQVRAVKLEHSEDSTAYLVTAGSVKIAFTGDTGICEPLIETINSADIAVCEWSFTEKFPQTKGRVILEIVESENFSNYHFLADFIKAAKKTGFRFAIDDSGTGYSNFSYLSRLHLDYIKFDGSLINKINSDKNSRIIIRNISALCRELGIKTITEFVENENIFNQVSDYGIDYSRGFYIGEPSPSITECGRI